MTGRRPGGRRTEVSKDDYYRGVRTAPYDLLKELAIATVALLVVVPPGL